MLVFNSNLSPSMGVGTLLDLNIMTFNYKVFGGDGYWSGRPRDLDKWFGQDPSIAVWPQYTGWPFSELVDCPICKDIRLEHPDIFIPDCHRHWPSMTVQLRAIVEKDNTRQLLLAKIKKDTGVDLSVDGSEDQS